MIHREVRDFLHLRECLYHFLFSNLVIFHVLRIRLFDGYVCKHCWCCSCREHPRGHFVNISTVFELSRICTRCKSRRQPFWDHFDEFITLLSITHSPLGGADSFSARTLFILYLLEQCLRPSCAPLFETSCFIINILEVFYLPSCASVIASAFCALFLTYKLFILLTGFFLLSIHSFYG